MSKLLMLWRKRQEKLQSQQTTISKCGISFLNCNTRNRRQRSNNYNSLKESYFYTRILYLVKPSSMRTASKAFSDRIKNFFFKHPFSGYLNHDQSLHHEKRNHKSGSVVHRKYKHHE